ncbi:MAG TPA: FHA domain-containing protein, partial [Thermoanaerobaculia bacterium]|nr:FHA domain-containing protein [Thermoanaerobaculia bacterium]
MSFVVQRVRGGLESGVELAGTALMQFIEGDILLVGRGATAQLRFDETTVALEHARLRLREGSLELEDCGSLTGTYVNGRQVERTVLAEGDWIEIGRHRLTVHLEPPDSVVLLLQQIAEERAATKPQPDTKLVAPRIDYSAAYALRRPPFV